MILKVDLQCRRCYKKISKAICQVQEKVNIQEILFNEKTNTVTISGPFDAKKVCQKLCCKAYSVIKEIDIKDVKEKPKEAPNQPAKPAEPAKEKPKEAKPAEPSKDKPKEAKPAQPAEPKKDKPKDAEKPKDAKPAEPKKDKPKDADKPKEAKPAEPAEVKKDKPKEVKFAEPEGEKEKPKALEWLRSEPMYFDQPVQGYEPVWAKPACGCQGYYGNSMCCGCAGGGGYGGAGGYGWGQPGPSQVVYGKPVYDGYNNGSHNYFCEEDPQSCSIM